MRKFWLTMHPDVFIWIRNEEICVYDAESGILLKNLFSEELKKIVDELLETDNLYTTSITEKDLEVLPIKNWIESLIANGCCDWVPDDEEHPKPVSLKPILKITDDIKYYKECHSKGQNANLLSNLHKLVIHLNGSEYGNDMYARQCPYPFKNQEGLGWEKLYGFMSSAGKSVTFSEVVFVGCPWKYADCTKLYEFVKQIPIKVSVFCTEQDYDDYMAGERNMPKEYNVCVLKSRYPENDSLFKKWVVQEDIAWHFILTSEEDYMAASRLTETYGIENYRLFPVYAGNNKSFFEDFIYTSEDDILEYKPSKREIFANQTLNTNFFGTLWILPDGTVSGGNRVIGNLEDSLYDVVYREMTEGGSWFHIRKEAPCCDCCYQWLCPAPSCYETVLKKPNLCNVVK